MLKDMLSSVNRSQSRLRVAVLISTAKAMHLGIYQATIKVEVARRLNKNEILLVPISMTRPDVSLETLIYNWAARYVRTGFRIRFLAQLSSLC